MIALQDFFYIFHSPHYRAIREAFVLFILIDRRFSLWRWHTHKKTRISFNSHMYVKNKPLQQCIISIERNDLDLTQNRPLIEIDGIFEMSLESIDYRNEQLLQKSRYQNGSNFWVDWPYQGKLDLKKQIAFKKFLVEFRETK